MIKKPVAALLLAAGFACAIAAAPASAQTSASAPPIKIGWLVALTGPNSSPGIGFDRGIKYAAEEINKAGGVKGRKIEVITRDTQGDPTKAVNAALELINKEKVEFTIGPTNSGEGLATTPVIARSKVPSLVFGVVDTLIDPGKYPHAFRVLPANQQWTEAAQNYAIKQLKAKNVGIIGDASGYGTATVNLSESTLKALGINVSYKGLIEANQTDLTAEIQKAKNAGTEVMLVWTDSAGLNSRLMNARADAGWNVPLVGHPAMGSGAVRPLLAKPENWNDVFIIGYRTMSFDSAGKLPARTQKFLDEVSKSVRIDDTTLWWVAAGYDSIQLIRHAVETSGSSAPDDVKRALESTKNFPGVFGSYSYSADNHNGYPVADIAMNRANSFRTGAYSLAPGYGN
jgi:branched-chain amino acid transport system substrate-binding protein